MRIGGFMQAVDPIGQELAQVFPRHRTHLAMSGVCGTLVARASATLRRAVTGSLKRSFAADGRCALPPCTPPIFPRLGIKLINHQRSFAQTKKICGSTFIGTEVVPRWLTKESHTKEGSTICRLPNGLPAPHAPLLWPLVVIRRWSRAFLARVPGQGLLSCLTGIRSRALSSGVRPTCFTASRTQVAADLVAGQRQSQFDQSQPYLNTPTQRHRTLRSGGFLLSAAALSASPSTGKLHRCQDQEGT